VQGGKTAAKGAVLWPAFYARKGCPGGPTEIGRLLVTRFALNRGRRRAVKGGKMFWPGSARERGRNGGMILFSGEPAVLLGKILWPGPVRAVACGK